MKSVEVAGKRMSAFMRWLFNRDLTKESKRTNGALTAEGDTSPGQGQDLARPMFVDYEALARRQNALFGGLTPVHERAALVSFVGSGITDANRYEDASAAFDQLLLRAPAHEGMLIQVFTHKLRDESKGSDFLYLHVAGDPLTFGFLICALTGGGLMAGWKLS